MRLDSNDLDGLIDDALRTYSSAEPLDGLEERIVRRVAAAPSAPPRRWLMPFSIAAAALAVFMVSGILLRSWREPLVQTSEVSARRLTGHTFAPQKPASAQRTPRLPSQHSRNPESGGVENRRATAGRRLRNRLPQMERFPSPSPITAGERALAVWAATAPLEVRDAMADLQKQTSEPILIKPLEINP